LVEAKPNSTLLAGSDADGQVVGQSCVFEEVAGVKAGGLEDQADFAVRDQRGALQHALALLQLEFSDLVGGDGCARVDLQDAAGIEGDAAASRAGARADKSRIQGGREAVPRCWPSCCTNTPASLKVKLVAVLKVLAM
jgi:hypothetical protein